MPKKLSMKEAARKDEAGSKYGFQSAIGLLKWLFEGRVVRTINGKPPDKTGNATVTTEVEIPDFSDTFAPKEHEHSGYAATEHTHTKSDITDFSHTHTKNQITDFSHTHTKGDITDFPAIPTKTSDLTNDSGFITNAGVTGVKGNAESSYRTGNVNLTPANIGALPLSGGTMTGQIKKAGVSKSWVEGRDGASLRNTSLSGYSPFLSIKTNNGSWEIGAYNNSSFYDRLIFTYISDANYNSQNNAVSAQISLTADGWLSSAKISAANILSGTLPADRLPTSGVTAANYGPSANASPGHSGSFSVPYITVDNKGRITAAATRTITLPSSGNTDANWNPTVVCLWTNSSPTSTFPAQALGGQNSSIANKTIKFAWVVMYTSNDKDVSGTGISMLPRINSTIAGESHFGESDVSNSIGFTTGEYYYGRRTEQTNSTLRVVNSTGTWALPIGQGHRNNANGAKWCIPYKVYVMY